MEHCNVCHEIDCECDENVLDYKRRVEIALQWALRRMVYAHDTHPDSIGPITINRMKRIKEEFKLEVVI